MGLHSTSRRGWLKARSTFAKAVLRLLGWHFHTTSDINLMRDEAHRLPPKFVVFGEPHTHWADLPLMLLFFWAYRLPPVSFPVRDIYFKPVLGTWLRWVGAIPVDTTRSNGMVDDIVQRMGQAERFIIHIPPSGTRRRTDRWRSGFYHIARQAQVPVFMGYLDGATKRFGYAPPLHLSGDVVRDMDQVRAFYADKRGLVPANESVIALREELAAGAAHTAPTSQSSATDNDR
jgi:1-acyl-sn-glycerol-3-phosphate acyltransferase